MSGQSTRGRLFVMIALMQDGSVSAAPAGLPSSPGLGQRLREATRRDWPVWLIALGVFANGSLDIMVLLTVRMPHGAERFRMFLPFGLLAGWNRTATIVLGVTMIYVSFHLLRRRRIAWWLASSAVGLVTVFHLLDWHRAYLALASAILLGFLLSTRSRFTGRFQMREVLSGLRLMLITLAVAVMGSPRFLAARLPLLRPRNRVWGCFSPDSPPVRPRRKPGPDNAKLGRSLVPTVHLRAGGDR